MLGSSVESYLETEFVSGHVAAVGDDDYVVRLRVRKIDDEIEVYPPTGMSEALPAQMPRPCGTDEESEIARYVTGT